MQLIAHRGCAGQYPENTVYAVQQAAPHVDAIEVDVRQCASGELVVFHDAGLERLTGQGGMVADTPWSELRKRRIEGTPHGIPKLSELLRAIPAEVGLDLELKVSGVVEDVLELVEPTDHEFTLTANQAAVAETIMDHSSRPDGGFIFWEDPRRGIEAAHRLGCDLIVPEASLCLGTDLIDTAHTHGFEVWVWTVNDRETARRLKQAGADGMIVDRWDVR